MIDMKMVDEMARRFNEALPGGVSIWKQDTEQHLRALMHNIIEQMHLVTHDEMIIKDILLEKTLSQVDDLEKRVAALEALLKKESL